MERDLVIQKVEQGTSREINTGLSTNPNSSLPEDRVGKVRDFGEMKTYLPDDLREGTLNLLDEYFKATRLIQKGKKTKARKKLKGLENRKLGKDRDFKKFEVENRDLLSRIQKAVLGRSSQDKTTPLQQKTIRYK